MSKQTFGTLSYIQWMPRQEGTFECGEGGPTLYWVHFFALTSSYHRCLYLSFWILIFFGFTPLNTLPSCPFLILATDDDLLNYKSKYLAKNRLFALSTVSSIVKYLSSYTYIPNFMLFYACSSNLLSMLQNSHYAAHMLQHVAATQFLHSRAISN